MSAPDQTVRQTPLHDIHVAAGARMVPFAGYSMPLQYAGIIEEHRAVREAAGIFDVSHMGEFLVSGPDATPFVQHVITNDVEKLSEGRALYTVMCRESGGVIDDLLVYRLGSDRLLLVVNASNIQKDLSHLKAVASQLGMDVSIEDRSEQTALIAIQGPRSLDIVTEASNLDVSSLRPFSFVQPDPDDFFGCEDAIVASTGYTGEAGLEIYCEPSRAEFVWQALMGAGADSGLTPCGLGARDTLRLEAGFCLYGNDLDDETTPLEAGLGWVVKLDKGDFVGRAALADQKDVGPRRRLVGFGMIERAIPRQGYAIEDGDSNVIGEVTSGGQSPILGRGIGMGYVTNEPRFTDPSSPIFISIRGRSVAAEVAKPPFHKTLS